MRTEYYFVASYVNIKLQTHSTNTPWWQSTVQHITSFIFGEEREVLSSQRLSVCVCVCVCEHEPQEHFPTEPTGVCVCGCVWVCVGGCVCVCGSMNYKSFFVEKPQVWVVVGVCRV